MHCRGRPADRRRRGSGRRGSARSLTVTYGADPRQAERTDDDRRRGAAVDRRARARVSRRSTRGGPRSTSWPTGCTARSGVEIELSVASRSDAREFSPDAAGPPGARERGGRRPRRARGRVLRRPRRRRAGRARAGRDAVRPQRDRRQPLAGGSGRPGGRRDRGAGRGARAGVDAMRGDDAARARSIPAMPNAHSHAFQRGAARSRRASRARRRRRLLDVADRDVPRSPTTLDPEPGCAGSRSRRTARWPAPATASSASFTTSTTSRTARRTTSRTRWPLAVAEAAVDAGLPIVLLPAAYHRGGWDGEDLPPAPGQRRFCDPDVETFLGRVDALRDVGGHECRGRRRDRRPQRARGPGGVARGDRRVLRAPRDRAPRPRARAAARARRVPGRARLLADRAARAHRLPRSARRA